MSLFVSVVALALCTGDRLELALDHAGDNRSELQVVLDHYEVSGDSQKYEAACFLIENMAGHNYAELVFFDLDDNRVEFDSLSYANYDEASAAMSALEKESGEVHYGRGETVHDTQTITSEYLINNIDLAFQSWQNNPWSIEVSFEDFCEYILPYRGSNEPVEFWRGELMEKFSNLAEEMENPLDPKEAGRLLERKANQMVGFDPIFYLHPTDQGFTEMKARGLGRCEDITNMQIYARRAGGVAVASDYTPHWAKSGNNHAWSVVIGADGKGYSPISGVAAKVYRKTFSEQLSSLGSMLEEGESAPRWLKGKYYEDVTDSYVDTSDVGIWLPEIPTGTKYAYLSVFNSGHWRPIQWSSVQTNSATFVGMGQDIVYLPMFHIDGENIPAGEPFILQKDGSTRTLLGGGEEVAIETNETTERRVAYEDWTDESVTVPLKNDTVYELFVWNNDAWESLIKVIGGTKVTTFDSLHQGMLYWLVDSNGDREERPFTIENGSIVRW
ncbi:MAG: hypothetical protein HOK75_03250 [Phycisphaerae bacterium]|jgi:hypothetical protein|nr:hypothetical protein [Phycisphaerae bacterium]MBT5409264.1 hypothetical protein [Phycisphaerae bacterium]